MYIRSTSQKKLSLDQILSMPTSLEYFKFPPITHPLYGNTVPEKVQGYNGLAIAQHEHGIFFKDGDVSRFS